MGWRWFVAWALAGGVLTLALLTAMSIGLFLAPVALLLLVLVGRRARPWPESLGMVAGVGAVCVAVAALSWASRPGGGTPNPAGWLAVGIVLVVGAAMLYVAARRSGAACPVRARRR